MERRRRVRSSSPAELHTIRKCVCFSRLLLGDDGHEGGNLLGLDLRVLDLLAVAVRRAVLSAGERKFWHVEFGRESGARRWKRCESRRNGARTKRRSAVDRTGRTLEPRHISRAIVGTGSLEPHARWKSPCAASGGASAPPRLQVSGFWGSIRTTHLLGPGFGVALGGLGVDVRRRANDEAHGGTDHDSHVSVCGVARRGAARSEGATDVDRDNRHRKRRKENEEAWPAVRPRWRRPRVRPLSLKNARIKKDEKTKTARHTSDRIIL